MRAVVEIVQMFFGCCCCVFFVFGWHGGEQIARLAVIYDDGWIFYLQVFEATQSLGG